MIEFADNLASSQSTVEAEQEETQRSLTSIPHMQEADPSVTAISRYDVVPFPSSVTVMESLPPSGETDSLPQPSTRTTDSGFHSPSESSIIRGTSSKCSACSSSQNS